MNKTIYFYMRKIKISFTLQFGHFNISVLLFFNIFEFHYKATKTEYKAYVNETVEKGKCYQYYQ